MGKNNQGLSHKLQRAGRETKDTPQMPWHPANQMEVTPCPTNVQNLQVQNLLAPKEHYFNHMDFTPGPHNPQIQHHSHLPQYHRTAKPHFVCVVLLYDSSPLLSIFCTQFSARWLLAGL